MTQTQTQLESLKALYNKNSKSMINDFFTFLRFQSVSSEPAYKEQILLCASWLKNYIQEMGLEVQQWETSGHPTLFATHLKAGPNKPTVLIYLHYDVQPVDPLELWESPPFEPTVRDGKVFARGAQDNKGQCFYTISAIKTLLQRDGSLPVNLKLCIEGEEEISSPGLKGILESKKKELQADHLLIIDLGLLNAETPCITLGVRGLTCMTVELSGSSQDLHSGYYGGLAYNPNHALVELLAKLRDPSGKVTVPHFYDDVVDFPKKERDRLFFDFDEQEYETETGGKAIGGESNLSRKEANWLRPTLELNGISGGYSGSGFKTVIPAKAVAKLSCRLVPDQDPKKIARLVSDFLKSHVKKGVEIKVDVRPGSSTSIRTNPSTTTAQVVAAAYEEVMNKPCKAILSGASIPVATDLAAASNASILFMGYGLASDLIHAPNENFGLDRFEKGFLTVGRILELFGR